LFSLFFQIICHQFQATAITTWKIMKLSSSLFALSFLLNQGVSQSKDWTPSSLRKAEVVGDVEKQGHDLSLLSKTVDVSHSGRNLEAIAGGSTLVAGSYASVGALSLTGILYLDPQGDSTSQWILTVNGAFTMAADCKVMFLDDSGDPANVVWVIGNAGPASLGAGAYIIGKMDVAGAVTIGAGGTIDGAVNAGGAVTVAADSNVLGEIEAVGAVTLGAGSFVDGSITSDAAISLGADAQVNGSLLSTTNAAITLGAGATIQTPTSGASGDPHCKCCLYSQ
jgi:cytoskeletal protein CcmA (bactofilin family)